MGIISADTGTVNVHTWSRPNELFAYVATRWRTYIHIHIWMYILYNWIIAHFVRAPGVINSLCMTWRLAIATLRLHRDDGGLLQGVHHPSVWIFHRTRIHYHFTCLNAMTLISLDLFSFTHNTTMKIEKIFVIDSIRVAVAVRKCYSKGWVSVECVYRTIYDSWLFTKCPN